jgi:hypothetical protein
MDLISILATVILVTTIGTTVVGVGAYAAFKLRDKRKPAPRKAGGDGRADATREPIFLKRYVPKSAAEPTSDEP